MLSQGNVLLDSVRVVGQLNLMVLMRVEDRVAVKLADLRRNEINQEAGR